MEITAALNSIVSKDIATSPLAERPLSLMTPMTVFDADQILKVQTGIGHPQAAARASARAGFSNRTPPEMISNTPSRSSLVNVRLTVSMVRPRKSAMS